MVDLVLSHLDIGINFQNMHDLGWQWGYFMILFIMLVVGVSLVIYFRRKKWL